MRILKSFFMIGVYDPLMHNCWPWHFYYEDGKYLSEKQRICSRNKAALFETADEARLFYHSWKNRERYKMEVIEFKTWVEVPDPEYPKGHPREILDRLIRDKSRSCYRITLALWFGGLDPLENMGQSTRIRHRNILLKYGVDIFEQPSQNILDLWNESKSAKHSDFEFQSKPQPTVVK